MNKKNAGETTEQSGGREVFLDVRPILEGGSEPFPVIMETLEAMGPEQALRLRAPFEPIPLYAVMGARGYAHRTQRMSDVTGADCWEVLFYRLPDENPVEEEGLVEADVRGLDAADMEEQVLARLEGGRYENVLLIRSDGEPEALYPILAERGFSWRVESDGGNGRLIRIWRNR